MAITTTLRLALQSLRSRRFTSMLTVASIALSVTLLVGIEHVRAGVRESFAGTIRGVDLIVGARGGTLQLLLSTVFGIGAPTGSVSISTYERWAAHPAVAWSIPYAMGDSHRGYRVVGTTAAFYERYRFRQSGRVTFAQGAAPVAATDVVLGAEVAERLRYGMGSPVVVTHGLQGGGIADHDAHPFTVSGVLARTFTPIDRTIYVTLDGLDAMHEESVQPLTMGPPQEDAQITAFFIGTRNRFESLQLQREMNTDREEPLSAVIPGVALGELWRNIGSAEVGLRIVAAFAVAIGLTGMLVALYASLDARRREMAILRAIGAGPRTIVSLLVLESAMLSLVGCVVGVALVYLLFTVGQGPIEARSGVHLAVRALGATEWKYLMLVVGAGTVVGVVPAVKAYRTSLTDGLSPRT